MSRERVEANGDGADKRGLLLGLILFFLWLAISLAAYYLAQNAFLQPVLAQLTETRWAGPAFELGAWGRTLLDGATAVWIALAALGSGLFLLRPLKVELSPGETLLFGLGLGLGAFGLGILGLGLLGLLNRWLLVGLLVLLSALTGRAVYSLGRTIRWPRPGRLLTFYLVTALGLALTAALLPPGSWDGLFYHLTGPQHYLEAGRIGPPIDVPHFNFPALFEMLFLLGLAVRGGTTAVLLHYLFNLLLAALLYKMARRHFRVANGWWAVIFLYAMPMVFTLASQAYNDLPLAFYEVGALYALLSWRAGQQAGQAQRGWLLLSALFSGLAMGHKYTSFVAPLALALLLGWWSRRELGQLMRRWLLFSGLALLLLLPWLAKNWAFTGNPVYPFVADGRYWDDFRAEAYAESGTGIAYDPESCTETDTTYLVGQHPTGCDFSPLYLGGQLLLLPLNLTMGINEASRDGFIGPLFLLFLPLIFLYLFSRTRRKPVAFAPILFFVALQFLFWLIGVISSAALWQSRLLLPAFVALCPLLAWLLQDLERFDRPSFSLQRQLKLIISLVLLAGAAIQLLNWLPLQPWLYLSGAESETADLRRRLGAHYLAMERINEDLPVDSTIYFLWEPRSYYCQLDCWPDSILDRYGHARFTYGDADGIAAAWREAGVDYLLLHQAGLEFVLWANSPSQEEPLPPPDTLVQLQARHLELVARIGDGAYELYRLR